jgi:outer membrane lipoprotein carrier protein
MNIGRAGFPALISKARHEDPARRLLVLKGHGFSRAASCCKFDSALAAEGMRPRESECRAGAKAHIFSRTGAARLKSCPDTKHLRTAARLIVFAAVSITLLLGAAMSCLAQQPALSAHDLAQRVDRHYNQLHSLKAGFTESYEGLGMQRTESGTLLLLKPGRMRWDYSTPSGKVFLLDGKYAWFYSPGEPQVQRMQAKQLDDLRSPLRFLLGHTELEKEMDSLTLAPAVAGGFTLSGQPKGQEKRVNRLSLAVTAEGTITGIEIEESDGAVTRFTFSGEVLNPALPTDEFHFTPPAGLPVIDEAPPV